MKQHDMVYYKGDYECERFQNIESFCQVFAGDIAEILSKASYITIEKKLLKLKQNTINDIF